MASPIRLRARLTVLTAILALSMVVPAGADASGIIIIGHKSKPDPQARIERVIQIAKEQIGDPWVWGMRGPGAFDCSGLVYYAFQQAHELRVIGGHWLGVAGLRDLYEARHRASRHDPKRGDLVIWGSSKHVGIYLGRGLAISALVNGVRIHGVNELYDPFTTYLHVRW
jgi:cell wall-associated NlpC family hydrolase